MKPIIIIIPKSPKVDPPSSHRSPCRASFAIVWFYRPTIIAVSKFNDYAKTAHTLVNDPISGIKAYDLSYLSPWFWNLDKL